MPSLCKIIRSTCSQLAESQKATVHRFRQLLWQPDRRSLQQVHAWLYTANKLRKDPSRNYASWKPRHFHRQHGPGYLQVSLGMLAKRWACHRQDMVGSANQRSLASELDKDNEGLGLGLYWDHGKQKGNYYSI